MIVVLLSCLNHLQARNDSVPPSTGGVQWSDTTIVINIGYIRLANAKMIERNYLLRINNEQDSIISLKDEYIREQEKIIADFQQRVYESNRIAKNIEEDLERQRKRNKIIGWSAGAAVIGVIIGIIAK